MIIVFLSIMIPYYIMYIYIYIQDSEWPLSNDIPIVNPQCLTNKITVLLSFSQNCWWLIHFFCSLNSH